MHDQDVLAQLRDAGLVVDALDATGQLQRVPVEGDRGSKRSGWYVAHVIRTAEGRELTFGTFGNWKTGEIAKVQYKRDGLSDAEHERVRAQIKRDREDAQRRRAELAQQAATRAAKPSAS